MRLVWNREFVCCTTVKGRVVAHYSRDGGDRFACRWRSRCFLKYDATSRPNPCVCWSVSDRKESAILLMWSKRTRFSRPSAARGPLIAGICPASLVPPIGQGPFIEINLLNIHETLFFSFEWFTVPKRTRFGQKKSNVKTSIFRSSGFSLAVPDQVNVSPRNRRTLKISISLLNGRVKFLLSAICVCYLDYLL